MAETIACLNCGGTGRIDTSQCQEIVKGRQCKHRNTPSRYDDEYYQNCPERIPWKIYCPFHRNMRAREAWRMQRAQASADTVTSS